MSKRRPKGTGMVRERGGGRQLVVTIGGKQYSRSVDTRTLREARDMLPAFINEIRSGAVAEAAAVKAKAKEAPTFAVAAADFVQRELQGIDKAATRKAYANCLARVGKVLGPIKVSAIDRHMIRDCLVTVNGESAPSTTKLVHCVLNLFFKYLVDREKITASPVPTFKALKLPAATRQTIRREALTGGQVTALLQACGDDDALRLWVETMAATGMRPGEALALTWGSIDFERGIVRVDHSVKESGISGQGRLGSTKTPGSVRDVPIGPALTAALEAAYRGCETFYRQYNMKVETSDCVFPADLIDARNVPKSTGAMSAKFKQARTAAGLPKVTPHYLRHTFATAAIAGTATTPGVSMVDAAALLGHKDASMVSKRYGHAVQANLSRGVTLADAMIARRPIPDNVTRMPARK